MNRLVAALLALFCSAVSGAEPPDLVLVNGKILTVDDRFSVAQALAVKGGRIVAVGSTAGIRKLSGPDTKVVDAQGRTVIPGLIDNHAHFVRVAEKWHSET